MLDDFYKCVILINQLSEYDIDIVLLINGHYLNWIWLANWYHMIQHVHMGGNLNLGLYIIIILTLYMNSQNTQILNMNLKSYLSWTWTLGLKTCSIT